MNINMKNVVLSKKDGWVWINEIVDGQLKPTTKLLYDDGKYTDNELRVLEQQIRGQNIYNAWDAEDDISATWDYMLTAADAFGIMASTPVEIAENYAESLTKFLGNSSEMFLLVSEDGNSEDERLALMETIIVDAIFRIKTFATEGVVKGIMGAAGDVAAVYYPSFVAIMKLTKCTSMSELQSVVKNGLDYTEEEKKSSLLSDRDKERVLAGKQKYTSSEIEEIFAREVVLNRICAEIMGMMMKTGVLLAKDGGAAGLLFGGLVFAEAKPLSAGIKNYLSSNWTELRKGNINIVNFFTGLGTEVLKANINFMDLYDNLSGASANYISWKYNGEQMSTTLNVDVPSLNDYTSDVTKIINNQITRMFSTGKFRIDDTRILGVKNILGTAEGMTQMLNALETNKSESDVPLIGYFDDHLSTNISSNYSYFNESAIRFEYSKDSKPQLYVYENARHSYEINRDLQLLTKVNKFQELIKAEINGNDIENNFKLEAGEYEIVKFENLVKTASYVQGNLSLMQRGFYYEEVKECNNSMYPFNIKGDDYLLVRNNGENTDVKYNEIFSMKFPITGNSRDNIIIGNERNPYLDENKSGETMEGNGGNDTIYGSYGKNIIFGGADNDTIHGGAYKELVHTISTKKYELKDITESNDDNSADTIYGGTGDDTIYGGKGDDILYGEGYENNEEYKKNNEIVDIAGGNDTIYGEKGSDTIYGGAGDDILIGGYEDRTKKEYSVDTIYGNCGDDKIYGDDGNDTLYGGFEEEDVSDEGSNYIVGGAGADKIYGGHGNDILVGGISAKDGIRDKKDVIWQILSEDMTLKREGILLIQMALNERGIKKSTALDYLIEVFDSPLKYSAKFSIEMGERFIEGIRAALGDVFETDTLYGGAGNDRLYGGRGTDKYVFYEDRDEGQDLIVDSDKKGEIILKRADGAGGYIDEIIEGKLKIVNEERVIVKGDKEIAGVRWEEANGYTGTKSGTAVTIRYGAGYKNSITIEGMFKMGLLDAYSEYSGLGLYRNKSLYPVGEKIDDSLTAMSAWVGQFVSGMVSNAKAAIFRQSDPLILDLDGDGAETSPVADGTNFDLNADGFAERAGWVHRDDGLLVLDRNGNGKIESGRELFGDQTMLADGTLAPSGFVALSEFDMNKDGKIDANDKVYSQLSIWQDSNSDGVSQESELKSLNEMGISSIGLANNTINIVKNGNVEARKGSYQLSDGTTKDVTEYLFATNGMDTIDLNAVEVSEEVNFTQYSIFSAELEIYNI